MTWIISVPVWGDRYVRTFCELAAPALLAAAKRLGEPARFVVHTDAAEAVQRALPGQVVECRPLPRKPTYVALQESHADAVRLAAPGERVALLNADLVVSGNLLARCAEHFAAGVQAVTLIGIRTVLDFDSRPPVGAEPRALLDWAWTHRHQIIRDLEWPQGGSMLPTNLFWDRGASVVARAFHQHPVAVVKHDGIKFTSTIDGDLLDYFPREAVHVVTDPDDMAMIECSPAERRFPVRASQFTHQQVAASMRTRASPTHRWLFEHRIVVRGTGEEVADDGEIAERILRSLEQAQGVPAGDVARRPNPRVPAGNRHLMPGRPRR